MSQIAMQQGSPMICLLPLEKGSSFPATAEENQTNYASLVIYCVLSKSWRLRGIEVMMFDWTLNRNEGNESCWWTTPPSYEYAAY